MRLQPRGPRRAPGGADRAGRAAAGGRGAGPVVGGPHHRGRGRDAARTSPAGTPPRPAHDVERTSLACAGAGQGGRAVRARPAGGGVDRQAPAAAVAGRGPARAGRQAGSSAGAARPGGPIRQSPGRWGRRSPRRPTSRRGRRRSSSGGPARSSPGEGQAGREPSRATMFRLFARLSAGKHTTGSAATRRSWAGRPEPEVLLRLTRQRRAS